MSGLSEDGHTRERTKPMNAFVYASGLIEFSSSRPSGAMPLMSAKYRRPFKRAELDGLCRLGYDGEHLVPGMPEAADQGRAFDAMKDFIKIVDSTLGK